MIQPITAAMWFLTFLSLGSAGLLYFSFRNQLDASARYMLFGLCMVALANGIFALSDSLHLGFSIVLYMLVNSTVILTELAILFGLLTLNRPLPSTWFRYGVIATLLWVCVIEILRLFLDLRLIVMLSSAVPATVASATIVLCWLYTSPAFRQNLFVRIVLICQVAIVVFWVSRAILVANGIPVAVLVPTQLSTIMIIGYMTFLVFRSLAYVGIRASWAMQDYRDASRLNAELVGTMKERDRFFQRLITTNKAIGVGAFAASIAHQLNQPLTALSVQANVVKRQVDDPNLERSKILASTDAIVELSRKLSELVRSLHSLFTSNNDQRSPVRLGHMVSEVQRFIWPMLGEQQIELTLAIERNPNVMVNRSQIQQVLINVINNAAAACMQQPSSQRTIELIVNQDGQKAVLIVNDTGPGMSEQARQRAFELFDSSTHGMGFGLWLSRTIMVQHDGEIEITNRSSGGTTVTISLPTHD
jgi:signal transduction histidine kinase